MIRFTTTAVTAAALIAAVPSLSHAQTSVQFGLQTGSNPRQLGVYDQAHTFVPMGALDSTGHGFSIPAKSTAKTAAYTVASGDVNTQLTLGGSAFYTVTFNAPAGYAIGNYFLANTDTRAKKIVLSGGATYTLWPGQSDIISNLTGAWVAFNGPRRYVKNAPTCYVDKAAGQTIGNTDGLAAGAGAFTTFQGCYQNALANFDTAGGPFNVQLTAGQTYTALDDFAFNGLVPGSYGTTVYGNGASIIVGGSTTPVGQGAVSYIGASGQVSIGNLSTVSCTAPNCSDFSISYPGELNVYAPVSYGQATQAHNQASGPGSVLYITGFNYALTPTANTIAGNAPYHNQAVQGGFLIDYSSSNVLSANVTFSAQFALASVGGILQGPGGAAYPITLGSFTVSGQRWYSNLNGVINNTSGCPANYWPGSISGGPSATGGQCN
jgi:hypothetical protein